jgi:two-component system OmpR family sensor kinase/two-component system sensor histidine kinase BaeS
MTSAMHPPAQAVPSDAYHSVRRIRRRLFWLLMQAFGAIVALTLALLLALLAVFIGRTILSGEAAFSPELTRELRAYYLGRGSWEGVESLRREQTFQLPPGLDWNSALLLDAHGQVLIDGGRADTPQIGQPYVFASGDIRFPVNVGGQQVGTLVIRGAAIEPFSLAWSALRGLALPVSVISFFTGLLTLLIGFLLARRVVTPLADVMAAAHDVAAGDLSARVLVRGPGDLRGLSDSFNRMAEALERNDRERRALLADIAHELRTPLTVMRGRLEGIVDGIYPLDEDHVAPVLEETYLLERLVEDLRLLTLAEARQLHFDRAQIDLGEIARRAADLFAAEAAENGVALRVHTEPHLPPVFADPQRTEQVIGNLLSNAVRYVPAQGNVALDVQRAAQGVEVAVSDDGLGVPEADLPKLFDRFWRGEKSRTRATGGAGLGLAIARQLVEAQGGKITASNLPGGGLRVAFVLPIVK